MWRRFVLSLALLLSLTSAWSPSTAAQEINETSRDVIFVLDASESMSGRINDEIKMDTVKSASLQTIADLKAHSNIGVIAYGHRTERDCDDIETLVTLDTLPHATINEAVKNIQPKGKTPLTKAVRRAADTFENRKSATSIVLITDGPETCGGDPCALGRELASRNANLKTHIIGVDFAGRNTSALRCLASETGGTFLEVDDSASLVLALNEITADIQSNAPPSLPTLAPPSILTTPAPVPRK